MKIESLADEALESEKVVLGSLILDPNLFETLTITGEDLSKQHHAIFDAMLDVFIKSGSVDTLLVFAELQRREQSWEGAAVYVSTLTDFVPRRAALRGHCERIRAHSLRRKLARVCEMTLSQCYEAVANPTELLDQLRTGLTAIQADRPNNDLGLVRGSDVVAEVVRWLIAPYLPQGQLTLLVGDPGQGKTFVSLDIAAGMTVGRPPFSPPCAPRNVLYFSNEDAPSILRGRFDALGGDPKRIWFESAERIITLADHSAIEAAVNQHEAALIVVDTVTTHFGAKVDFHKASEVAAVLNPLTAMAQRTGAAILGLMHLNKSLQANSLYRVQGSTAFAGSARSILAIGTDPSDPTTRVMTHLKSNGAAEGTSQRFTIGSAGVVWCGTTELRAADVLGAEATTEDRSAKSAAMDFLREALASGSRNAKELEREAEAAGIHVRTLRRAKIELGVKHRKASSFTGGWIWWLHGDGSQNNEEDEVDKKRTN